MVKLIFKNEKCIGYATVAYNSSDSDESVVEKTKKELNSILPDSLDGGWKNHRRGYIIVDGKVSFDEGYDPDANDPTSGGS